MQTRLYLFPFDDLIKIFIGNVNVVKLLCYFVVSLTLITKIIMATKYSL